MIMFTPALVYFDVWRLLSTGALSYQATVAMSEAAFAGFVLLNGYLLATAGQTIGKRLVGTRIVNVSDDKVPRLTTVLGCLHDLIAGTIVINALPSVESQIDTGPPS
jgi:uncharacterized RDD family membrane protein YckC